VKPEPSAFEVRNELFAPDGKLLQTFKKKIVPRKPNGLLAFGFSWHKI